MQEKAIFIGFDGGGSNSRILLQDSTGKIIRHDIAQSIKYIDVGVKESARMLLEMISQTAYGIEWYCAYITISLSGASDNRKNEEFIQILKEYATPKEIYCHIESDSSFSLSSAYPNYSSGVLIISGTGSVAIARDLQGQIHKVGGWGRLLGDEGSGYWVGLQALKHYAKASDKMHEKGILFRKLKPLLDEVSNGDFASLRSILYSNTLYPAKFASLVFECAEDPIAQTIIKEGARHLVDNIHSLMHHSNNAIANTVTLHGSVATHPLTLKYMEELLPTDFQIKTLSSEDVLKYALSLSLASAN